MQINQNIDKAIKYLFMLFALSACISTAGTSIAIGLIILFMIIRYRQISFDIVPETGFLWAISVFLGTMLITVLLSHNTRLSLDVFQGHIIRILIVFITFALIRSRQQILLLMVILAISINIDNIYAVWQYLKNPAGYRPVGFNNSATFYATHLLEVTIISLITIVDCKNLLPKYRLFFSITAMFSFIMLILNQTRGAWLALAAVLLVYGLINRRHWQKVIILILIMSFAFGTALAFSPSLQERFVSIINVKHETNTERVLMWKSSLEIFNDYPLTGVGPGGFRHFYNQIYISPLAREYGHGSPHNNFLLSLTETGIIGIIGVLYLWGYLLYFFARDWFQYDRVWSLVALLVTIAILVQGLTDHNFENPSIMRLYWFIIGIAFASRKVWDYES